MVSNNNSSFSDSIITPSVVFQLQYYDSLAPDADDVLKHQASDIQRVSSLGKGSYCDVSLVISRSTKEQLAMKKLDYKKITSPEEFLIAAPDLALEGHYLSKFNHPNIIKLRGSSSIRFSDSFSECKEGYFLTMDVMSETLKDRLRRWHTDPSCYKRRKGICSLLMKKKKLDMRSMYGRLETVALGIAKAMDYIHQQGAVLRDLKPENVGFHAETGEVCLFDFGFARDLVMCSPDEICGTPRYMAPEVLRGEGYSLKSDVYSFGVLLHELVSLQKRKAHKKVSIESQSDLMDACSTVSEFSLDEIPCKHVAYLIETCLSQSPQARPSFETIIATLTAILGCSSKTTELRLKPFNMSETDTPSVFKPSVYAASNVTMETLPDFDTDDMCLEGNTEW